MKFTPSLPFMNDTFKQNIHPRRSDEYFKVRKNPLSWRQSPLPNISTLNDTFQSVIFTGTSSMFPGEYMANTNDGGSLNQALTKTAE